MLPPVRDRRIIRRMALRIHESVVRGEIDNRVRGMVRGKIWIEGRAQPVAQRQKINRR